MNVRLKNIDYLQRMVDVIAVSIAWAISYYVKFVLEIGGQAADSHVDDYLNKYIVYGVMLALISMVTFKNTKVYDAIRFEHISKEVLLQLRSNVTAFVIFLVFSFFVSKFRLSRVILITYFALSSLFLTWSKIYFRRVISKFPSKLVLVGNGKSIIDYYHKIKPIKNFVVDYWVNPPKEFESEVKVKDEVDCKHLESQNIDGVVLGFNLSESEKLDNILKELSEYLIPIIVLPDLQYSKLGHSYRDFKGQPLIYLNDPNVKTVNLALKRLFDIVAVTLGMVAISPLLILIALLVKLTSKGPIFYGQVRMGVDGKEFKMWKFRSMVTGSANKEGWTVKDDPRVTPIGKFIRKTSLDELPQLWNVLMGDMSLVGPRPERPVYVEQFRKEIPSYMLRHKYKAGITGWAQINGWRGDTSIERRIDCDLWYIKNWSLSLDIYIILMTFWKGFVNKNAY